MRRAVNPQTGEVLFLVNNQWTAPARTARNPETGQSAYLVNNEWQILDPLQKQEEEKGLFENITGLSTEQFAEAAVPEFDVVKRGLAAAIQGVSGAPAGIEAAARAPVRQIMGEGLLEQSELYQLGRRLFGREPTPEEIAETNARKIETDRIINDSIPLIPGLQDLAEGGRNVAEFIRERQSPEALEAVRGSQIQGNLLEAVKTGDFSQLSFGENPTLYGYALQGADVLGSLFPVIIASAIGPVAAGVTGGGMAAGEASQNAKEYVKSKTDVELAAASPYYKDLIASGVSPKQAREIISERAAEQAAFLQGSVATIGGVATQKIISGAADKAINATGRNRLMRIAAGGALAGAEEGAQEFLEGVASDLGINKEVIKEIGEDSFANFVLGFIGGAPVGMARGALQDVPEAPPGAPPAETPPVDTGAIEPDDTAPLVEKEAAPLGQAPGVLQTYTNPLDESAAEVIATGDGRFSVRFVDLATGQSMDGGTFDTPDEANSIAAQVTGVAPKAIQAIAATPAAAPAVAPAETAQAPAIPESGFRTEKGSVYALDDLGRTSRTKMSEGKGKGTTYEPHFAFYVNPEDAQNILSDMQSGAVDKSTSVRLGYLDPENNAFQTVTDTSKIPAGAEAVVGVVDKNRNQLIGSYKAQLKPAVGLSPVEKLYTPDGMSSTHIGNKIVEIFGQKETKAPGIPPEILSPEVEQVPADTRRRASLPEDRLREKPFPLTEEERQENLAKVAKEKELFRQRRAVEETRGYNNLLDVLSGKAAVPKKVPEGASKPLPDGLLAEDADFRRIDFGLGRSAKTRRNSFLSKTGKGKTLVSLVEDGALNAFLKNPVTFTEEYDPLNIDRVRDGVDEIIERIENNDFLTTADKNELDRINEDIRKLEKELTLEEVNTRLAEIAAEERNREAEGLATRFPEEDLGGDQTFEAREPTPEERRRADLERDLFRLTPPAIPERTTPPGAQGDMFGARGAQRAPAAQAPAELTPIEQAARQKPKSFFAGLVSEFGYNRLDINDPRTYKNKSGKPFLTFEKDGVRIAFEPTTLLYVDDRERVGMYMGNDNDMTFAALLVDPQERKKGKATQALKDVIRMADEMGTNVYMEPTSLDAGAMSTAQLKEFYKRFGFEPQKTDPPSGKVMIRKAGTAVAAEPKTGDVVGTIPLPDNMEVRIFKTTDGYGASMYDKDADEVVQGSVRRFRGDDAQRKAEAHAKEIESKVTVPERAARPSREEQAAINRARQAERREATKQPEKTKIEAQKEKNREQLKLFEEGPITENEDNPAGKAARRNAVSTVDDLQSTNNPLALALSKDYAARQRVSLVGQTVKSHDDLAVLSQVYRDPTFETSRVFFVNDAGEVVSQIGITSRLPGSTSAFIGDDGRKYVEKLQAAAKQSGATGVWMLHNHPSGNVTPSNADRAMTRAFAKAFDELNYKGHIVIDTNAYTVIDPSGSFIILNKDMSQENLVKYEPKEYKEIFEPISIAKRIDENPESMVIIVANAELKVNGISSIDNAFFKNRTPAQIRRALYKLTLSKSGSRIMVASRDLEALKKVAIFADDGIYIEQNGQYKGLSELFRRTAFLFPISRPGVLTTDTSKLFDFLRVPKAKTKDASYFKWPDMRQLLEKSTEDFIAREPQEMTEAQIDEGITRTREEQVAEYTKLRARRAKLIEDVIGGGATLETQRELTNLTNLTKELKGEIDAGYTPSKSPEMFLKRALEAYDKGDLSAEVLATIQEAYNKTPFVLNGLRLSIKSQKEGGREIGNFNPLARIVTLWNGTRAVEKPTTIRHELMHSLEQMMTPAQRKVVIDAWEKDLSKAIKKNKDAQSQLYFKKVLEFIDRPSQESFVAATSAMPSYEFYQYLNPSEYWAVNAETLMSSKLGTAWDRFVSAIKKYFDALKNVFGFNNRYAVHKTFDQLMSDKPKRMSVGSLTDFVAETGARPVTLSNIGKNIFGQPMPEASWGRPDDSKIDNIIYTLQDKMIDTKMVLKSIRQAGKQIIDKWDPYLQEELYHGRTAKQTDDFLKKDLEPLMKEMGDRGLTMAQVEEYLHNRHAKSRNEFNAKRDKNMPDGGSGIMTADAQAYLDGLDPKQKRNLETVAKMVDDIVKGTQEVIVATGQESQETIDAWNKALKNYVPLQREEADYDVKNVGIGVGSGFAVKGPFSRAAVGSSKNVVDILANLAMQRERAIVRGEKMRVAKALYGLVASNPNPGFWLAFDPEAIKKPQDAINELVAMGLSPEDAKNLVDEPVDRRVDPVTNTVVEKPNALLVNSETSMPVRINGKEKYIIFNANDPRAERMAKALKNLDADQISKLLNYVQQVTQYFAKINTQYNPIFGVINFLRDVQGAMLQLSTTPLRNDRKKVLGGVTGALRGIYAEERLRRKGEPPSKNSWAELWEEFQQEGGQTGFRDQFSRAQERADALQAILDPSSWTKSPLGKVFTAGGTLKVPLETARKVAAPIFDWLSDYNQTMENAVRLSAYKVAKDKGMTKQQAASLAKNLTVNFNRKGQIGRQAGAWYAFFNAAVQGTARMWQTLRGPAGKTIVGGGLLIGSAQAMMLAALGFDEDEPPEFVKERNIIIPTGGSKYITIPMPLGYNVIPNTSRILTEWWLSGFKDTHKRVAQITGAALDMFNPLGNAGWSAQTLSPTVFDPFVALTENKDWTGKPIAKEDISNLDPTPGYTRSKETASYISKAMAKFLNFATGGTDYTPGEFSPTPDQIDYLIGQLTGGVGRELLKAEQTVTSQFTGEELPIYKVPLVGRFIGDSEGQAAERNRFYNNLILLNKHEREIKGRLKDRVPTKDYLMEYPEARLYSYANQVERNIRALRKQRDMLIEKGAPKERVKRIENQMTTQMQRFNERVKQAQD